MKKTLTVLASAVLALSMLFMAGCNHETMNAEDIASWKHQLRGEKAETLELTVDNGAIDWWAITDLNNKVVFSGNKLEQNQSVPFEQEFAKNTFEKGKKRYVLWIHQPAIKADKNSNAGDNTFAGAFTIKEGEGVKIKASDYSEVRGKVGILSINNNETENQTWHGTYEITKAIPMKPLADGKFELLGGLEINTTIDPGKTFNFVWPAGKGQRIGLYQPNRFDPDVSRDTGKTQEQEREAQARQARWYWTQVVNLADYGTATIQSSQNDAAIEIGTNTLLTEDGKPFESKMATMPMVQVIDETDFMYDAVNVK